MLYCTNRLRIISVCFYRSPLCRAAGSGTASRAMAVPVFLQKKHSKNISLKTQKHHRYTFIVQYDIIITTFPHNRFARICSDIAAVSVLVVCIFNRMINRMLKLNDNKTEMVIYMSQYHLNKHGRCDMSIGDSTISPVECVRSLGVQIYQHLTMDKQVTAVCKACNFHLYRLSSIRRYITTDAARSVVQALVTSRLDYCNSLLANLTNTQMKRLKSIQHKAARLVTRTPLREHITPVLKQLHWLPVECRITYKLMVMVYKCMNGTAPAYLCRLIKPKCRDSRLRQPIDLELHRPVPNKAIGAAAFGFAGPDRWNKLPERLRESASLNIFKRD